jgi:hypothetical protein
MALLEDENVVWNDIIFLRTIKSIAEDGDIDISSNILAELSPSYKRKRANSLSQRMSIEVEASPPLHNHPPTDSSTISKASSPKGLIRKKAPHRPSEHEKWKIIPKKISDKAQFD